MGIERIGEEKGARGNLIQDIVSIEVEADRIVAQAREAAAAILKKAQGQAAEVLSGVEGTIKAEFEKLRAHYERVLEAEKKNLEEAHKHTLHRVSTVDEEKRKALVADIVKRVVEVTSVGSKE